MDIQPYSGADGGNGGGNGNFQNTIDWGLVGASTASVSLDILSRYCAAKVDHYTLAIGEKLCDYWFDLSLAGRRNVTDALQALPCNNTFGDYLWMGFGARHIVRTMSQTSQGLTCLALIGAFSEFFHEDFAAEILHDMVKSVKAPSHLTPSIFQWKSLVHACAGVLGQSNLGVLIEELIQHNPAYWRADADPASYQKADRNGSPDPQSIADALQAIGDISKGRVGAITIMGGNIAGWLAGIAEWMFSLSITIQDTQEKVLYTNCEQSSPQIIFIFTNTAPGSGTFGDSQKLQCVGKTYVLEDATQLFTTQSQAGTATVIGGRLAWKDMFSRFFGSAFESLLVNESLTFGTALGNAARILHAIVHAEDSIPRDVIAEWKLYGSSSYGNGFIAFITWRFPELDSTRATMDAAASVSLNEAQSSYQNQMTKLQYTCEARGCKRCKAGGVNGWSSTNKFCQVILVETILALALALSTTQIAEGLYPKHMGLVTFYNCQGAVHQHQDDNNRLSLKDETGISLGPFANVCSGIFRWSKASSLYSTNIGLSEVFMELFTGFRIPQSSVTGNSVTAIASGGICTYSGVLSKRSIENHDLEEISTIYICTGNIEYDGRPFDLVIDDRSQHTKMLHDDPLPRFLDPSCQIKVQAKENVSSLGVWYQLCPPNATLNEIIPVLPAEFAEWVRFARGWISCDYVDCKQICDLEIAKDNSFEAVGTRFKLAHDAPIYKSATLARTIQQIEHTGKLAGVLVRNKACINCSIRAALSGPLGNWYQFGGKRLEKGLEWILV